MEIFEGREGRKKVAEVDVGGWALRDIVALMRIEVWLMGRLCEIKKP